MSGLQKFARFMCSLTMLLIAATHLIQGEPITFRRGLTGRVFAGLYLAMAIVALWTSRSAPPAQE